MPKIELPIANGYYQSESLPISNQRCVNFYPNIPQASALGSETLFGTPGITLIDTTGTIQQVNRGAHVMAGVYYFVNGNALYRVNRTVVEGEDIFSIDSLGTITGSGRVSMADNGTELVILVPGGLGSVWNHVTETFTPDINAVDPDFTANGAAQVVVFIDGYFLYTTDSKKFFISELNNALSYIATDFGSAEADPDIIRSVIVHSNQVFIFGSETVEVFANQPSGAGFPFVRIGGFIIPKGISSAFGVIESNNTFMFIGAGTNESPAIWELAGGGVSKVSTTAIDKELSSYTDEEVRNSFSWSYSDKGAYFVGFTFASTVFVYDVISGRWHERLSRIDEENTDRWRPNSINAAYGRIVVGDSKDGRIGFLDDQNYTEYDNPIIAFVTTQPFSNEGDPIFVSGIELTPEAGTGTATLDPQVGLSWSDDGKTFNNPLYRGLGKIGEYDRRCIWRRLGRFPRLRVLKFTISDPAKRVFIKCEADIRG